jgi:hypothetical protein
LLDVPPELLELLELPEELPELLFLEDPFLAALEEYSACSVSGPAMPSSHRPLVFFWKASTAAAVSSSYLPVTLPLSQPSSISRRCSVSTFLPFAPMSR